MLVFLLLSCYFALLPFALLCFVIVSDYFIVVVGDDLNLKSSPSIEASLHNSILLLIIPLPHIKSFYNLSNYLFIILSIHSLGPAP
jgi:hypothetical protein